jgi:membrane associated rhomboid family serine protease
MKNIPIILALALVAVMLWSWFVPVETRESVAWWAHQTEQRAESMVR